MPLNFRYNDATYTLAEVPGSTTGDGLSYNKSGTTYKCPASTTQGTAVTWGQYLIDNTSPTIHFNKNGQVFHCAKTATLGNPVTLTITHSWSRGTSQEITGLSVKYNSGTISHNISITAKLRKYEDATSINTQTGQITASNTSWEWNTGVGFNNGYMICDWTIDGGRNPVTFTTKLTPAISETSAGVTKEIVVYCAV